ncbi:MAG TPA: MinD/ParA family protein [Alphaproteobacteria bacterium]|nr:MinD/ParA family protein [Alphaproteobacteria bacterium]
MKALNGKSDASIVAVASGKGGVGKTWLAITLAQSFAEAGQRTLLFDGDLGLANVDIQLGLVPTRDLGHFGNGIGLHKVVTKFAPGGFDIIAGRSGSGTLAAMDTQRLGELMGALAELAVSYDRVILDLGAGVEPPVRALGGLARVGLVVATDEPTSLTDAYAFIKLSLASGAARDLRVVVNLAGSPREGERTYGTISKACREFLKYEPPLAGIVRRDPKVRDAIRAQTPLLTRYPTSEAAADVRALARNLLSG